MIRTMKHAVWRDLKRYPVHPPRDERDGVTAMSGVDIPFGVPTTGETPEIAVHHFPAKDRAGGAHV